jgi:hypothetical protein
VAVPLALTFHGITLYRLRHTEFPTEGQRRFRMLAISLLLWTFIFLPSYMKERVIDTTTVKPVTIQRLCQRVTQELENFKLKIKQ